MPHLLRRVPFRLCHLHRWRRRRRSQGRSQDMSQHIKISARQEVIAATVASDPSVVFFASDAPHHTASGHGHCTREKYRKAPGSVVPPSSPRQIHQPSDLRHGQILLIADRLSSSDLTVERASLLHFSGSVPDLGRSWSTNTSRTDKDLVALCGNVNTFELSLDEAKPAVEKKLASKSEKADERPLLKRNCDGEEVPLNQTCTHFRIIIRNSRNQVRQ